MSIYNLYDDYLLLGADEVFQYTDQGVVWQKDDASSNPTSITLWRLGNIVHFKLSKITFPNASSNPAANITATLSQAIPSAYLPTLTGGVTEWDLASGVFQETGAMSPNLYTSIHAVYDGSTNSFRLDKSLADAFVIAGGETQVIMGWYNLNF